jgi:hypothetical protein
VTTIEALTEAWGEEPPEIERIRFLSLPDDRRAVAVDRIRVLQHLIRRDPPATRKEQEKIAGQLGIGLKRLQGLMRQWRAQPSVDLATPHARPIKRPRRPTPPKQIAERTIDKALARDPWAHEPPISRRVAAICARLGLTPPARTTIRRMLDRKAQDIPFERRFPEGWETAGTPEPELFAGEHLLLIREYFQAAVRVGAEQAERASAVLLIDMITGFVLGASPAADLPALGSEAARAVCGNESFDIGCLRPPKKLLVACDLPATTSARLRRAAEDLGVEIDHPQRRHIRRWTASLLWAGFDRLPPVPPPSRRSEAPPADWPIMSDAEFESVLDHAIHRNRIDRERTLDERGGGATEGGKEYARIMKLLFGEVREN